jgi:ubiquitin-protein ligase
MAKKALQRFLLLLEDEDLSEYFTCSLRYPPDADITVQVLDVTLSNGHKLEVHFTMAFPLSPPDIRFLQPFPNIPGICSDGRVPYLGRGMSDWGPAVGLRGLLLTAVTLCE